MAEVGIKRKNTGGKEGLKNKVLKKGDREKKRKKDVTLRRSSPTKKQFFCTKKA